MKDVIFEQHAQASRRPYSQNCTIAELWRAVGLGRCCVDKTSGRMFLAFSNKYHDRQLFLILINGVLPLQTYASNEYVSNQGKPVWEKSRVFAAKSARLPSS